MSEAAPMAVRFIAFSLFMALPGFAQLTIGGDQGVTAQLASDGSYSISIPNPGWQLRGSLGVRPYNSRIASGDDNLGSYTELAFDYAAGNSDRSASIRTYPNRSIVMFAVTYGNASANSAPFPVFSSSPAGLQHVTYSGMFAGPSFAGFAPDSPWVYFDAAANTFILSPASDFMTAETRHGANNQIEAAISGKIVSLPAGFTHKTVLAFGAGINRTIAAWGRTLTDLTGKVRPSNDADTLLKRVSYWTDNGATYYYNPGPGSYPETLHSIRQQFDSKGIGLGSIQLDSWWYSKGPDNGWFSHGGIWTYAASPGVFAGGLAGLRSNLGVPLVTHARWIDEASPYRSQYKMSGNVATDPRYWEDIANYLQASGVTTYEQDWLGLNAEAAFNLTDPQAFLSNMAASMTKRGITMQYCMAEPKHFLQSTNYSNLTTVRTGQDRFVPEGWSNFLYSGRFASVLGAFPFTDVFMSTERDNLILATLSAGPVGVGDAIGSLSASNLLKSVRRDGVIVKPDVPVTPVDSAYLADARNLDTPMVAATYSDFGGMRANYIFAYPRGANTQIAIQPSDYGISGPAWLYDYGTGKGTLVDANAAAAINLTGPGYFVLVAAGNSGIAFLGDRDQFVTLGKARIPALRDDGKLEVSIAFAPGETVRTLFGYSPWAVAASATSGSVDAPLWDASTQLFAVNVHPTGTETAQVRIAQAFAHPATTGIGCGFRCSGGPESPTPGDAR